jgi:cold shock CspA family protein
MRPAAAQQQSPSMRGVSFGIILSLLDGYGFIQSLDSTDHVYFAIKDMPPICRPADEVMFQMRVGPRGAAAVNISPLNPALKVVIQEVAGVISKEPDPHRHITGAIEYTPPGGDVVAKIPAALLPEEFTSSQTRMVKGDEVTFALETIPGSSYFRARCVVVKRTKRERQIAEQIKGMFDMGIPRCQGIVDSIKGEYGFIRRVDSPIQIYFRVDDVIQKDTIVTEGAEVDFFVIVETAKGKMSDRAIHLGVLPVGTVVFEIILAEKVRAVVVEEPKVYGTKEDPGMLELMSPIVKPDGTEIREVELWQRCLPPGLLCKPGDILSIEVRHYRPDNLIFARSVTVEKYRKISRSYGVVVTVKDDRFGFIKTLSNAQAYFRAGEVYSTLKGGYVKESDINQGMVVSFDLTLDSGGKSRAVRVLQESSLPGLTDEDSRYLLLKSGMTGTVHREWKKDQVGQILVHISGSLTLADIDAPLYQSSSIVHDVTIAEAVQEAIQTRAIREVVIEQLTSSQRRAWHLALNDLGKGLLAHETLESSAASDVTGAESKVKSIRIWKVSAEEYTNWASERAALGKHAEEQLSSFVKPWDPDNLIMFAKTDCNDTFGPIMKDLQVLLDVYYDRKSGYRVAKNVTLTDDPVIDSVDDSDLAHYESIGFSVPVYHDPGFTGCQASYGVIDVCKGKFGFIRRIPSDERLFYHGTAVVAYFTQSSRSEIDPNDIQEGRPVLFFIRKRGGFRCAVNIRLLDKGSLRGLSILRAPLTAVSVGEGRFILTDVSNCPLLYGKISKISLAAATCKHGIKAGTVSRSWRSDGADGAANPAPTGDFAQSADEEAELTSNSESDIKHFTTLASMPLFAKDDPPHLREFLAGTMVTCQAVVDWAAQRFPVMLCNVTKVEQGGYIGRRTGIISKLKVLLKDKDFDLSEITESSASRAASNSSHEVWFCDSRDLKRGANAGDEVDFIGVEGTQMAVDVISKLASSSSLSGGDLDGIVFKRTPVNAALKASNRSGVRGVVMAEGPPSDNAVGFPPDWRGVPLTISSLPWSHLFGNLQKG